MMKPALAFRQPNPPTSWLALPNGELILEAINQELTGWWPRFFGYYLLKIGALSGEIDSSASPISKHLTLNSAATGAEVVAEIDDLPLLKHSVDVCILSHMLEFSLDPHHVVREANRVLIPNGYLVITGYNPFSLAGLNKLVPYRRQKSPWCERFFSPMRVKDWLHLMGFEILADQRTLHTNLANKVGQGKLAKKWKAISDQYFTSLGSVYVIVAKKRVLPLTPIKPKWRIRPQFEPVKVTSMSSSNCQSTGRLAPRSHGSTD